MTRTKTVLRLSLVIERVEVGPSPGAPFPRPVINTTGVEVRDSELPPSTPGIRVARVYPFAAIRRAAR